MSLWTITVGAVTRSPQGWGIDWNAKKFNFVSWQADVMEFSMSKATVMDDPIFAFRDKVVLKKDGVIWFVGRVVKPSITAESPKEVQTYTVKNVWNDLENLILEQARNTRVAADNFASLVTAWTTRAVIGARVAENGVEKIDAKQSITDFLDYAIAEGLELQYDVDFTAMTLPYQEATNLSVAAAMRKAVALLPDATTRWNYTTTPPTLIIRRRATEVPVTLDLIDLANGLVSFSSIEADYDLVPSGVEITVQGGVTNPADNLRYALLTRQEYKVAGGIVSPGRVPASPDRSRLIRGTVVLAADGTLDTEAGLENLAQEIAEALKTPFWNGTLNFAHEEVPGTFRPGHLINFANAQTAMATAKAIVQEVTEVPGTGRTTVRVGRPPWLSKGTLDEVNRLIAEMRNPTNAVGTFYPGFTSHPDAPDAFGLREYTFDLAGWTFPGTAVHGSATFTVQLTSRISCDIKLTAFSLIYDILGTSIGLATWHTYDATDAEVSSSLYTPSSLPLPGGAKLGHPTGTFKVRFRLNGAAGPEDAVYTVSVPSTGTPATLKVALNANP